MLGTLTIAAIEQGPIVFAAQAFVALGALAVILLLTHFRLWGYLWREWLTSLDAKRIGIMYIVLALVMLVRGGIDALMMRAEQATGAGAPGYLAPAHFAQIFTAHGTIMIFFVAMPLMFGLMNAVLPLMIGTRDVAFPFLNSVSFWLTAAGAALAMLSLVVGQFATTGWTAYPPLSELAYSPGVGVDYYLWSLQIAGIGTLLSGVNFMATILAKRCPGMTLMRMPMYVWTVLAAMALVIFAFPVLTATLAMLALDRYLGMHFFTASGGGNMMMYVNLFWAWGHPEVYILVLPAFGVFSEVVATFSHKRLFGYASMVGATAGIMGLSFVVWLHHFYTMGASPDVNSFFGIMTMIIAVPTGVKIFNWLFTMYRGRISFASPMLWFLGFVGLFTLGGMTGVLLSVPGADYLLHNSLFLVAHFHTMIVSGVLFGDFAAIVYWFPKAFGFRLFERWGKLAFWGWAAGFTIAFVPLYVLGFMGATRRLDYYPTGLGWQPLFMVAAAGVVIIALGGLAQAVQLITSIRARRALSDHAGDPWNGRTLEWAVPSPAPAYSFARLPQVSTRDALWEAKQGGAPVFSGAYEDIELPGNTAAGAYIGGGALALGFALVWHIWWLAALGALAVPALLIVHSFSDHAPLIITAAELAKRERLAPS